MFEKPNIRWTDGQTDSFWGWGGREAPQNFIADFENSVTRPVPHKKKQIDGNN